MEHNMLFNEMPTLITNIWKIMIKKESSDLMCWDMNYFPFFTKNDEDQKEQKACVQCEWAERIRYTLKNFKTKHLVMDYYCKKFIEQLNSIKNIA